jgi:hypothetical protein
MTLWERCDQIIKLIDETQSEVAVTQTAIPTVHVGPRVEGRQLAAPATVRRPT